MSNIQTKYFLNVIVTTKSRSMRSLLSILDIPASVLLFLVSLPVMVGLFTYTYARIIDDHPRNVALSFTAEFSDQYQRTFAAGTSVRAFSQSELETFRSRFPELLIVQQPPSADGGDGGINQIFLIGQIELDQSVTCSLDECIWNVYALTLNSLCDVLYSLGQIYAQVDLALATYSAVENIIERPCQNGEKIFFQNGTYEYKNMFGDLEFQALEAFYYDNIEDEISIPIGSFLLSTVTTSVWMVIALIHLSILRFTRTVSAAISSRRRAFTSQHLYLLSYSIVGNFAAFLWLIVSVFFIFF